MIQMDTFKQRALWVAALIFLIWCLYLAQDALLSLCFGFVFASAMMPVVEALESKKLPRWLSVLIVFMIFVAIFLLVIIPTALLAFDQLQRLLESFPNLLERLKGLEADWTHWVTKYPALKNLDVNKMLEQIGSYGSSVVAGFTGATLAVSKGAMNMLTALIISYFLILDREKIQNYFTRFLPPQETSWLTDLVDNLLRTTGAFVNGQMMFMATSATLLVIGLGLVNAPFALLFGLIGGLSNIIPIFGAVLVMLIHTGLTWFQTGDGGLTLWVFGIYLVVQVLENNIIGPLIMGKAVGLHPLAILLSIMLGGALLGFPGIILGIPLAASLKILLEADALHKVLSPHKIK
jgi:predicted PurR-regulated permease PerM